MTHRAGALSPCSVSHALRQCGLYSKTADHMSLELAIGLCAVVQIGMAYADIIAERLRASRATGTRPGG